MLSIITAIYNLKDMNRLYYESLMKHTFYPFELIIIDNGSTDGSVEYFEKMPNVVVVKNDGNYSYPYCQNIGIKHAKYRWLVFMNNDIVVSPQWDKRALEIMQKHNLDIATCVATDRTEDEHSTYKSRKRWKHIRIPLFTAFGTQMWNLKLMIRLMYGNWETFTQKRYETFGNTIKIGISGSNVILTRRCIELIGLWDERIQAADFDIFLRARQRNKNHGDIQPAQLLLGVYLHHYCRLTMKQKYPPFKDLNNIISIEQKWDYNEALSLLEGTDLTIQASKK